MEKRSNKVDETKVPTLSAGAFFGDSQLTAATCLFQFSELQATIPEREVPRHAHETPHFILVADGVYRTEARNQPGLYGAGTLIFNPAGTTHRDCFRSDRGTFISITPGPVMNDLLEKAPTFSLVMTSPVCPDQRLTSLSSQIAHQLRLRDKLPVTLDGLGLELIALLNKIGADSNTVTIPPWLQQARRVMEDCVADALNIEDLAGIAGVHPVYLARAHRRHFGCSPGDYLRRCRLLRVQELLADTDLALTEIALCCGFSDQSQMTRAFSGAYGVPPSRYRRLRRQ